MTHTNNWLECARILRGIMRQVTIPCSEQDPDERQHPQQIILFNGDIRAARRAIAELEEEQLL